MIDPMMIRREKPKIQLDDSNVFSIFEITYNAAKKNGWSEEEWEQFKKKISFIKYEEMVSIIMEYFDLEIK